MARHVMDDLRKDGRVPRAQLGVTVQPVTSDMAASLGLKDVGRRDRQLGDAGQRGGPRGVKRGDVIQSVQRPDRSATSTPAQPCG